MEFPWSIYSFMKRHKQGQILQSACPCFAALHEWINRNKEKSLVLVSAPIAVLAGRSISAAWILINWLPRPRWIAVIIIEFFIKGGILQVIKREFFPKWFKYQTSNFVTHVEASKPAKTQMWNKVHPNGIIKFWACKTGRLTLCVCVI